MLYLIYTNYLLWSVDYSWLDFAAINVDVLMLVIAQLSLLKLVILMVAPSLVIFFVYCCHFSDLNRVLLGFKCKNVKNSRKLSRRKTSRKVTFFLREHHRLVEYVLVASRFWSTAVGLFTVTNVPINLYMLGHLFRHGLHIEDLFTVVLILVMQFLGALNALIPIAQMSSALHSAGPLFVSVVQGLRMTPFTNGQPFHLKWKLAAYYEVIHSQRKISFHNGPFGTVTKVYILNVSYG